MGCEWTDYSDNLGGTVFQCVWVNLFDDGSTNTVTYSRDPTQFNLGATIPSSISGMTSLIKASSMISLDPCDAYNGVLNYLSYLPTETIIKPNQELGIAKSDTEETNTKDDADVTTSKGVDGTTDPDEDEGETTQESTEISNIDEDQQKEDDGGSSSSSSSSFSVVGHSTVVVIVAATSIIISITV